MDGGAASSASGRIHSTWADKMIEAHDKMAIQCNVPKKEKGAQVTHNLTRYSQISNPAKQMESFYEIELPNPGAQRQLGKKGTVQPHRVGLSPLDGH